MNNFLGKGVLAKKRTGVTKSNGGGCTIFVTRVRGVGAPIFVTQVRVGAPGNTSMLTL